MGDDDIRVVVLLVDGGDIRPARLLHAIVGSLEAWFGGQGSATACLYPRDRIVERACMVLTLAREHALANFANHGGEIAIDSLVGGGSGPRVRLTVGSLRTV